MIKRKILTGIMTAIMFFAGVPISGCDFVNDEPIGGTDVTSYETEENCENLTLRVTYPVPLEQEVQNHIIDLCKKYDIDPALVFAIIEKESQYDAYAVNDDEGCMGLMQIHTCNLIPYKLDKPFDPIENTRVGVQILAEHLEKYGDIEKALMAYHCGENGAKLLWEQGITSDEYTDSVLEIRQTIYEKGRVYYFEEDKP